MIQIEANSQNKMKEGLLEETNLSIMSERSRSRSKSRSRSRSTSSNRTITSTSSSIESAVDGDLIYEEGSRSSSPLFTTTASDVNCNKKRLLNDKNTEYVNKKLKLSNEHDESEYKQKHSTPVAMQQQHQQHHILAQYQSTNPYAMAAAAAAVAAQNYYANKGFALNMNKNLSPISNLKLLQHQQQRSPLTPESQSTSQHKALSLCAVCGDRASGKHYGVLSCDGCRGFFKRSIRGSMEYVCKENQKCIIDVSRRNQCQACRLRKCLEVKMNKDAVQHQRPPRSQQIRRDSNTNIQQLTQPQQTGTTCFNSPNVGVQSTMGTAATRFAPYNIQSAYVNAYLQHQQQSAAASLPIPSTATAHWNPYFSTPSNSSAFHSSSSLPSRFPTILPPSSSLPTTSTQPSFPFRQIGNLTNDFNTSAVSTTSPNISSTSSGYCTAEDNSVNDEQKEAATKLTIKKEVIEPDSKQNTPKKTDTSLTAATIATPTTTAPKTNPNPIIESWSHQPTDNIYEIATRILFAAVKWARTQRSFSSLPFTDQVIILEECWPELFVLTAAEFKPILNESMFLMRLNEQNFERKKNIQNFLDHLTRFSAQHVDSIEYLLLKSIVLFKSNAKELREKVKIDTIQEELLSTMLNHDKINYNSTTRFGRLLLLIADTKCFSSKILEDMFFKNILGNTNSIDNLLFDIFKSC